MANFEDKMCRSAAETLMSSLESLHSIHFETQELSDELLVNTPLLTQPQRRELSHI